MARRGRIVQLNCQEDGCAERAYRQCDTAAEADEARDEARSWKCWRHRNPEELLTVERPRIVKAIVSCRKSHVAGTSALYWDGTCGLKTGPGFKAAAEDFPEGTILRITAEVVIPHNDDQVSEWANEDP
jgi:hypothetical protein